MYDINRLNHSVEDTTFRGGYDLNSNLTAKRSSSSSPSLPPAAAPMEESPVAGGASLLTLETPGSSSPADPVLPRGLILLLFGSWKSGEL